MLLWSDVCDCIKMDAFLVVALLKLQYVFGRGWRGIMLRSASVWLIVYDAMSFSRPCPQPVLVIFSHQRVLQLYLTVSVCMHERVIVVILSVCLSVCLSRSDFWRLQTINCFHYSSYIDALLK